MGHGEDAAQALALGLRLLGHLHQLRVGEDHRQRGFQLVGGVADELPLLAPGLFRRPDHPPGQKLRNGQKGQQAYKADAGEGSGQGFQGGLLAAHVREDQGAGGVAPGQQVSEVVLRDHAGIGSGFRYPEDQVFQKGFIGQIVIASGHRHQLPVSTDLDEEIGQLHLLGPAVGPPQLKGVLHHRLHHGEGLGLQIFPGEVVHQAEDQAQRHGDDGHKHTDEAKAQLFQHPSFTSSW